VPRQNQSTPSTPSNTFPVRWQYLLCSFHIPRRTIGYGFATKQFALYMQGQPHLYCRLTVHEILIPIVHSYRLGLQRGHNTKLIPFRSRVSATCSFDIQGGFLVRPCGPYLIPVSLLLLHPLLTSPMRSGSIALPSATTSGTWETSRGKTQSFPRVSAGFIKHAPVADGGLRGHVPTRPGRTTPHIRFLFVAPRFRIGLPSDPASRLRPCPSPILRLGEFLAWGLPPHKSCAMPRTHARADRCAAFFAHPRPARS
jgi:hypothetical protein